MTSGIEFRAMNATDLEQVAALAHRADPYGWSIRNFQDSLACGHDIVLAVQGRLVAGYAVTMQVFDEAELLEIAVEPRFQGIGIGRALLTLALKKACQNAARIMHLEVRIGNERARKMYGSAGFIKTGVRRGYYSGAHGREDAVTMSCEIAKSPYLVAAVSDCG